MTESRVHGDAGQGQAEPSDFVANSLKQLWLSPDRFNTVRAAGFEIGFQTELHPSRLEGQEIRWGDQLDVRPVRVPIDGHITDDAVAAYLAKYATKATEVAGHVSSRLNAATIGAYATGRTHPNMAAS